MTEDGLSLTTMVALPFVVVLDYIHIPLNSVCIY